ncbi:hypothetical protein RF11_14590 [Thelohanellus kitauei]|uniref:Uncharacterized protein n=1 Tax=Thelohanellus kitauei TaxID=669202 RepID=A0A0C2MU52_THEKT|nr:hypothetical protein RF11_14590 [Thelohanellus kitauei]
MNFEEFSEIKSNSVNGIGFLRHYVIRPEDMFCQQFSGKMVETQRKDVTDKDIKILLTKFLWVVRMWAYHQIGIGPFLSLSKKDFGSKNKICSWKLLMQDLALGGLWMIVQIDESVISRAMHNRARVLTRRWVVGMYDVAAKVNI